MKQTIFKTRRQVEDKIDYYKVKYRDLAIESEKLESEAKHNLNLSLKTKDEGEFSSLCDAAIHARNKAAKLNKSAARIEDSTLPKLKRALAAIDTETMPFAVGAGVVLE